VTRVVTVLATFVVDGSAPGAVVTVVVEAVVALVLVEPAVSACVSPSPRHWAPILAARRQVDIAAKLRNRRKVRRHSIARAQDIEQRLLIAHPCQRRIIFYAESLYPSGKCAS
jgi:hypothetical protein